MGFPDDTEFVKELKQNGWSEILNQWGGYVKGDWKIYFDTSSWMELETKDNPRVGIDIHVPVDSESFWTVHLIEHLCKMEDERHRLRKCLERIRDASTTSQAVRLIAQETLAQCYHTWLVDKNVPKGQLGHVYCPICKQTQKE